MKRPMNAVSSAVNSAVRTDCTIGRSSILYLCALSVALLLAIVDTSFARAPRTAKIAFSSNRDGAWDIFLMNPDGSKQVNLTRDHANNFSPVQPGLQQASTFYLSRNAAVPRISISWMPMAAMCTRFSGRRRGA